MALSTDEKVVALLMLYARALARLRGENAMLMAALKELQITQRELDYLNFEEIQKKAEQDFFERIEKIPPGFSAHVDDRAIDEV